MVEGKKELNWKWISSLLPAILSCFFTAVTALISSFTFALVHLKLNNIIWLSKLREKKISWWRKNRAWRQKMDSIFCVKELVFHLAIIPYGYILKSMAQVGSIYYNIYMKCRLSKHKKFYLLDSWKSIVIIVSFMTRAVHQFLY